MEGIFRSVKPIEGNYRKNILTSFQKRIRNVQTSKLHGTAITSINLVSSEVTYRSESKRSLTYYKSTRTFRRQWIRTDPTQKLRTNTIPIQSMSGPNISDTLSNVCTNATNVGEIGPYTSNHNKPYLQYTSLGQKMT